MLAIVIGVTLLGDILLMKFDSKMINSHDEWF